MIGVLYMIDGGEKDEKIICVAADDKHYEHVEDLSDLGKHLQDKVRHYFEHYKDLQHKKVEITGWGNRSEAINVIEKYRQ